MKSAKDTSHGRDMKQECQVPTNRSNGLEFVRANDRAKRVDAKPWISRPISLY